MNLRKNVFGYLIWFLYSIAVAFGCFGLGGALAKNAGISPYIGYGAAVGILLLDFLAIFLLRKLGEAIQRLGRMPLLVAESLTVVILLAVGTALRIMALDTAGGDMAYHEAALVAEGKSVPVVVHAAVYCYLQILHGIYFIFGNKMLAGIWLQILLQTAACILIYFALRQAAGAMTSLTVLAFLMMSPYVRAEALKLSPAMFFFVVYALAFLCVICCIRRGRLVGCLLTGLGIGAVCYLDSSGCTLLPVLVYGLMAQTDEDGRRLAQRIGGSLLVLLGAAAGMAALVGIDALSSSKSFLGVLSAWGSLFSPTGFAVRYELGRPGLFIEFVPMLFLMAMGIVAYWLCRRTEQYSGWILLAISLILLQSLGMTQASMDGSFLIYLSFAVLAGVGLNTAFAASDEEEPDEAAEANEETEPRIPEAADEEPRPAFIENPLPLPKKHVKKVMDYDLTTIRPIDDYDLEVSDDDDYDI